jgi:hypothetical protein
MNAIPNNTDKNSTHLSSIGRFRQRIETKCLCTGDIGRLLLMERAE